MQLETLGRYRLERALGHGGMAVVYRGYDEELGRVVAIKLLADNLAGDESFRRRFVREARVTARLTHPNIVRVYDAGEADGRPFIVMECVDGETLAELLEKDGFGIGIFGHVPLIWSWSGREAFGNIMPMRIDSKRVRWPSMNYNS